MESNEIRQTKSIKMAVKNDGSIQIESTKNANIFKSFYSDLGRNLARMLPVALNKFN